MTKQEILSDIFKTLHRLKATDRMLNGRKHPNKIQELEQEAQNLLEANFETIEDNDINTLINKINENAKKAKQEVLTTEDIHNEALRVASYIDETLDTLKKIKEMI
jgi:hypothetical protein